MSIGPGPDMTPAQIEAWESFRAAARSLVECEQAFKYAQQNYADAIRKLSNACIVVTVNGEPEPAPAIDHPDEQPAG